MHLLQHQGIVRGVDEHRYPLPVFGTGAQHGRAADVDLLDGFVEAHAFLGNGLCKGVEIDAEQVDGGKALFLHILLVTSIVAARQ